MTRAHAAQLLESNRWQHYSPPSGKRSSSDEAKPSLSLRLLEAVETERVRGGDQYCSAPAIAAEQEPAGFRTSGIAVPEARIRRPHEGI